MEHRWIVARSSIRGSPREVRRSVRPRRTNGWCQRPACSFERPSGRGVRPGRTSRPNDSWMRRSAASPCSFCSPDTNDDHLWGGIAHGIKTRGIDRSLCPRRRGDTQKRSPETRKPGHPRRDEPGSSRIGVSGLEVPRWERARFPRVPPGQAAVLPEQPARLGPPGQLVPAAVVPSADAFPPRALGPAAARSYSARHRRPEQPQALRALFLVIPG